MSYSLEEKYDFIKKEIVNFDSKNPISIVKEMMKKDYINIHGPEHHFLDGAAFLVAFKNAGGQIDIISCLDMLSIRAENMPGAMCAYWGVCGAIASIGAALSILHNTEPISTDEYYKHNMEYTSVVLQKMSKIGGARCCKRNAFLALSYAVEFVKEKYNIQMECDKIECEFSALNKQCLKSKCPFFK